MSDEAPWLDARRIVGMLADPTRRAVVAGLVLGARTVADLRRSTGLSQRELVPALERLCGAGLVVHDDVDGWYLVEEAFRVAARAAAADDPTESDPFADEPTEVARVLRAFVRDHQLVAIPTTRAKRRVVLDLIAQDFEPGVRYPEHRVNLILTRWHHDWAALRRWMIDEGLMDRADGFYWRAGGSVPV